MTVNSFHVSTPRMMLKQSPECLIAHSSSHHSKMLWIAGNWKFPQKQHRRCPSHEILMRIISLSFLKHHQLDVLRFAMLSILIQNNNYSHTIQSSLSLVFHCYNLNVVKKRFLYRSQQISWSWKWMAITMSGWGKFWKYFLLMDFLFSFFIISLFLIKLWPSKTNITKS